MKGIKKLSRGKHRKDRKTKPLSLFIRGKITGETYFKLTKQKVRKQNIITIFVL